MSGTVFIYMLYCVIQIFRHIAGNFQIKIFSAEILFGSLFSIYILTRLFAAVNYNVFFIKRFLSGKFSVEYSFCQSSSENVP